MNKDTKLTFGLTAVVAILGVMFFMFDKTNSAQATTADGVAVIEPAAGDEGGMAEEVVDEGMEAVEDSMDEGMEAAEDTMEYSSGDLEYSSGDLMDDSMTEESADEGMEESMDEEMDGEEAVDEGAESEL